MYKETTNLLMVVLALNACAQPQKTLTASLNQTFARLRNSPRIYSWTATKICCEIDNGDTLVIDSGSISGMKVRICDRTGRPECEATVGDLHVDVTHDSEDHTRTILLNLTLRDNLGLVTDYVHKIPFPNPDDEDK